MTALRPVNGSSFGAAKAVKSIHDIPGWFPPTDQRMFGHFLSPGAYVPVGDLVELGVYLGKSAAFIGQFKREQEVFTVCDLFGRPAEAGSNLQENAKSYSTLDRAAFERNYLALFDELPVIVQDLSSAIVDHVAAGSARFLHVDASHMYDQVAIDVESARTLLRPDGVVVFDDYRTNHTPGVSAAVWEAVFTKGLKPVCLTEQKFYGTFGDRDAHQDRLRDWLSTSPDLWSETQLIDGAPVFRVAIKRTPRVAPESKKVPSQFGGPPPVTVERLRKRVTSLENQFAQLQSEIAGQSDIADRTTVGRRVIGYARRRGKRSHPGGGSR